ncbi:hypothetical protein A1O7_00954 [Cladophialophora yegresii CBS 114405]|uniref:Uncharacterized protein n=1 Tax=Cladophialophora yegresii CBS 114405 TaxID=1182544 RepID=W9W920_9EURO|nr:uncharacterized protein A1O7_00954 [Cladophialophora yegresii CBS 114405]EXJ64617.1 hypothetical protein A1O7_00954 [Cladophialophora yegresii CBS 114405]
MPRSSYAPTLLALLLAALPSTQAAPLSHLYKREISTGAKAGLGVGIAVIAIILIGLIAFFVIHFRRRAHLATINQERAILAGEKNQDGTDKPDKFAPPPTTNSGMPRRNKSVKDRLMGPLYRGSTIDLMPIPKPAFNPNRSSTMTTQSGDAAFLSKPWAGGESSPRPSFSSKRATRMMMMM